MRGKSDEIEITPEMIAAGGAKLYSSNAEADIAEEKVCEIFKAMLVRSPLCERARP